MSVLQDEIDAYETALPQLEADHLGAWVVFKGRRLVGAYADFQQAAAEAGRRFGRGPYLIRRVGEAPFALPPSLMFMHQA